MPDLSGKVAMVTGAASGIGRAMSRRLAADGAAVMCADWNEEGAQQTAAEISEHGGRSAVVKLDVSVEAEVRSALERTVEELGGLDILLNNAGVGGGYGWQRTIDINLTGVFNGLAHGAPMMAERGGGAIVNTASIAGLTGMVGYTRAGAPVPTAESYVGAYVAAKHGVVGLTRQFAVTYARHGVRVNAICPGYTETPMIEGISTVDESRRFVEGLHPMGRLGRPEEIAAAAAFLVSDEASYITGAALPVDGGYTAT